VNSPERQRYNRLDQRYPRVKSADVDSEQGVVVIEAIESENNDFSAMLLKMGYPESGAVEGIEAAKGKAKSFVSCAIARVDNRVNK
jgi:copper chaperone